MAIRIDRRARFEPWVAPRSGQIWEPLGHEGAARGPVFDNCVKLPAYAVRRIGWCGAGGEYNAGWALAEHPVKFTRIAVDPRQTGVFLVPVRLPERARTRAEGGAEYSRVARMKRRMPALRLTNADLARKAKLSRRHGSAAFPPR